MGINGGNLVEQEKDLAVLAAPSLTGVVSVATAVVPAARGKIQNPKPRRRQQAHSAPHHPS